MIRFNMNLEEFAEELSWIGESIWYGSYPQPKDRRDDYPRRQGAEKKLLDALKNMACTEVDGKPIMREIREMHNNNPQYAVGITSVAGDNEMFYATGKAGTEIIVADSGQDLGELFKTIHQTMHEQCAVVMMSSSWESAVFDNDGWGWEITESGEEIISKV